MKIHCFVIMLFSGLFLLYSQFDYVYGQNITQKLHQRILGLTLMIKIHLKNWQSRGGNGHTIYPWIKIPV